MPSTSHLKYCALCQCETEHISEANHAAGIAVFVVSVLSCGMLFPITLPLTLYFLLTKKPKSFCRACRSPSS